ncbi:MAG TPA: MBL fold metallo-hydrolase [Pyrinomonadaceae bacterium]|jgi:glyoxylase-like metal-dependent hydrolase (beta-lactamase superfamily II)|nr:MBL fold metallo-hydrolase [Pyrinomonadaceae bacterium]
MIIEQITVTAFEQHARIVGCEETRRAICIDPGSDDNRIVAALDRLGLELQAIALTHAHMDHVGGVAALKKLRPGAEIILHRDDEPLYRSLPQQPAVLGIPRAQWAALGFDYEVPPAIDRYWTDGETYEVGRLKFNVLYCPGHTPGHVILFEANERKVFAGDCLFAGSIGRTDLPGGSMNQLMNSLMSKIVPLGDDVVVYPGHGPETTIGRERLTNPFL